MKLEDNFSAAVIAKARKIEPENVAPMEGDPTVFLVESTRTGKKVRVQLLLDPDTGRSVEWRTCTCTNGNKRGGQASCYHASAAEMRWNAELR